MHKSLNKLCESLDALSKKIKDSWADDRNMNEVWGYHHPSLTRHDLALIPKKISDRIKENSINEIDKDTLKSIDALPEKLKRLEDSVIPHFFNGHGHQSVPAFIATMEFVDCITKNLFDWQVLVDNKALPVQLIKRLRSIQNGIEQIVPDQEKLKEQIQLIEEATATAEDLPTDLQSLKEARKTINDLSTKSSEAFNKIDENKKNSEFALSEINTKKSEAQKLVDQCEEAYRITTTKGLAAAFDQRASKLNTSMWIWVGGLLLALIFGSVIGFFRIGALTESLKVTDPNWGSIILNVILSAISVGAPLWFAWLATKQIGQRFRLAEDYAFKASVAKAYEGYRKEAARLDKAFESRLFSSALTRLDEAPLRLIETGAHGSPWHELFDSKTFQKVFETMPELKDRFMSIVEDNVTKKINRKSTKNESEA